MPINHVALVEMFIKDELDRRQPSGLLAYIEEAKAALLSIEEIRGTLEGIADADQTDASEDSCEDDESSDDENELG